MKSIFGGAKQQLSSCMQQDSDDTPPVILVANNDYNHHQHENHYQQHNGGFQAPTRRNHSPRHYSQPHTELNDHTASEHNNNNNVNSNFITAVTTPITGTSTYETLQRPFKHDRRRGQWSATADFYFACTSHAFGSIIFSEVPVYAMIFGGDLNSI
uniref:Uncharacterized protein n=1 Tax=Bactrocera latifrons TaxID=174628 RepID=A0A0K8UAZ8_BACLA